MLESSSKPSDHKFRAVIGQQRGASQIVIWEEKELTATHFTISDSGHLLFWSASQLIAAVESGSWQRVERVDLDD